MGRAYDPARLTRERLLILERREQARAEARAVAEGVAETVALARARGGAFEKPAPGRSGRETPYRRQTGLAWLLKKGRINAVQAAAGERYGDCYRAAGATPSLGSSWDLRPRDGTLRCRPLGQALREGMAREKAQTALAGLHRTLLGQLDLIVACDLVCGQELTPREAAGPDREAARLEAVLKVALDILAMAER